MKAAHGFEKPVTWHFIGNLQSRAAAQVAGLVNGFIGGVWSQRTIARLGQCGQNANVLLQVKIGSEDAKTGLLPDQLAGAVTQVQNYTNLRLRGLMGIATQMPEDADTSRTAHEFAKLRNLFEDIRKHIGSPETFDTLSMGMSNDWQIAVAEGATQLRLGQCIFGPRPQA